MIVLGGAHNHAFKIKREIQAYWDLFIKRDFFRREFKVTIVRKRENINILILAGGDDMAAIGREFHTKNSFATNKRFRKLFPIVSQNNPPFYRPKYEYYPAVFSR